jgi:hypothetical protein
MEWRKSPKIGMAIILVICVILYWFIMTPLDSYPPSPPVAQMVADPQYTKEMARQELAESENVFGNTMEESIVSKFYPAIPVPTNVQLKLRNVRPHS